MNFNSESQLQEYLLNRCKNVVIQMQERVYLIIDRFVKEYYAEFTPNVYERTYQLYKSLVKSKIERDRLGYKASVYFDLDSLDYHFKKVNGNYVPNNFEAPSGLSIEEYVLQEAAHGTSHGGLQTENTTAIWDLPINILNQEAINTLVKLLKQEGIPIKK